MRVKRFGARIAADPLGHAVIAVPFDPDEAWGAKARHHVNGTVNGCRVRVTIAPGDGGWAFTLNPWRINRAGDVGAGHRAGQVRQGGAVHRGRPAGSARWPTAGAGPADAAWGGHSSPWRGSTKAG